MAATRVVSGTLREVWRETVPLDGALSETITTGIRAVSTDLANVFGFLTIEGVVNNPNLSTTSTISGGFLQVTVSNSALPGNTAIFSLDVMLTHSIQQNRDTTAGAQIHVVSSSGAIGIIPANTVSNETAFGIATNAGTAATVSRSDHTHGTPTDPVPAHDASATVHTAATNLEHVKAETVTVALSGGQYTSVKAACDAVTLLGPTIATPYHIIVSAGVYNEDPLTVPPYTIVVGAGRENTVIKANSNVAHFITLSEGSELRKVAVDGPTALGQAAIRRNVVHADSSFVAAAIIRNGYYGILCDPAAGVGSIYVESTRYDADGSSCDQFIRVTGRGIGRCTSVVIVDPSGTLNNGFVCDGANADLTLDACGYNVVGGGDAVFVNNGGKVKGLSLLLENGTNAIHVGPDGASFVAIHGTMIRGLLAGFTKDIFIESAAANVHFSGSLSRSRIDNAVSAALTINATNIETGVDEGAMVLGEMSLGPTAAGMTPMLSYGQATWLTGLSSGGEVTRHGAGSRELHIAAGEGYINDGNHAHQATWGAGAVTITANSTEYVYVDLAGSLQHSIVQPSYDSNIVLARAVADATDIILLTRDEITVDQQASRVQEYFEDVIGPINVTGAATSINGGVATRIDISGGEFVVGLSNRTVAPLTATPFYYWYRTGAVWTMVSSTDVDTANYNNPATGLAAFGGLWKKDMTYLVVNSTGTEVHVVYGQETFANQPAAEAGNNPQPPDILNQYAQRSGGLVIASGGVAIASVTDARPRLGQAASTTVTAGDHDLLLHLNNDTHLQYLTTGRADTWHAALVAGGLAAPEHVTGGNAHAHTAGAGAQIDHTTCSNIGVNTHAQLDTHLIDVANPHVVTAAQVGAPPNARTLTAGAGLTGGGDLSADRTFNVAANADGSIIVNADDVQVGILATDAQHGVRGGGTQHAAVVAGVSNGFMTAAQATRLAAIIFGDSYQIVADATRTTLTGVGSTSYPPVGGLTKISLVTPALVAGTYKVSWTAVIDYSVTNRDAYIRIQNVTDATTLWESIYRPANTSERHSISGTTTLVFAGVPKTIAMQIHTSNTTDTMGIAYANIEIFRVI